MPLFSSALTHSSPKTLLQWLLKGNIINFTKFFQFASNHWKLVSAHCKFLFDELLVEINHDDGYNEDDSSDDDMEKAKPLQADASKKVCYSMERSSQ